VDVVDVAVRGRWVPGPEVAQVNPGLFRLRWFSRNAFIRPCAVQTRFPSLTSRFEPGPDASIYTLQDRRRTRRGAIVIESRVADMLARLGLRDQVKATAFALAKGARS
jgi:hypothetical protein